MTDIGTALKLKSMEDKLDRSLNELIETPQEGSGEITPPRKGTSQAMAEDKPSPEKGRIGPRDVFMHLLAMIALYISAANFLVLIFQYINVYLPDPLERFRSPSSSLRAIRLAIAFLVVFFPVYLYTTHYLKRDYQNLPFKRKAAIRKWLIYFTLFVAALIIIGDLVSLIFHFLEGGLTLRFLLKVLAVFFVASSIFYYYRWELKKYAGQD